MLFRNFSTELYIQNVEGYATQTVTIQALGKWEMDVIMDAIWGVCGGD